MVENNKEIWKDVPGYEGYYQASNLGRVRSLDRTITDMNGVERFYKGKIIDGVLNHGYRNIRLSMDNKGKTFKVSQLVAMAFLNHIPDGYNLVVDHKDGVRTNDRVENLRIVTHRANVSTCFRSDKDSFSSVYPGVSYHIRDCKWHVRINYGRDRVYIGSFSDEIEASKAYQLALKKIESGLFNPNDYKLKFLSDYKGVSKRSRKWISCITVNGRSKFLGTFTNEIEAAQAYNDYVINNNLNRKLNEIS